MGQRAWQKVNGNLVAEYSWGLLGPLMRRPSNVNNIRYYIQDGLGHTRALLDNAGNVTDRYVYEAWGGLNNSLSQTSTANPFRWNGAYGYEWIPVTGLYHVGAREYDPRVGRWLQRDPIDVASGDPHLYRYCLNDPINHTDPSGLDLFDDITNFAAGWGDALSLGLTDWIRDQLGVNDSVDTNSSAYGAGALTGAVHGLAMAGPGLVKTGLGVGRGIVGAYRAWRAGRGALQVGGEVCTNLYVYVSKETAAAIQEAGRFGRAPNPTVYLTPNGNLTPLQAQLELALPQHNTAQVVFEIPVSALNRSMIEIIRRVTGNINNRPGGGWEVIYRGFIPFSKAKPIGR